MSKFFCRCLIRQDEGNRTAEAAMIEANGGTIYRDSAGQFWCVWEGLPDRSVIRPERLKPLVKLPSSWHEVSAEEVNDFSSEKGER